MKRIHLPLAALMGATLLLGAGCFSGRSNPRSTTTVPEAGQMYTNETYGYSFIAAKGSDVSTPQDTPRFEQLLYSTKGEEAEGIEQFRRSGMTTVEAIEEYMRREAQAAVRADEAHVGRQTADVDEVRERVERVRGRGLGARQEVEQDHVAIARERVGVLG